MWKPTIILMIYLVCLTWAEDVRLDNLDPPEAQQIIDSKDTSLKYAPKIESNVPAVRYIGNTPQHVQEDIYLANQYHGQDGVGGYLYGYSVPDIAKTEKKKAGGDLRGAYNYVAGNGQEIKVEYWDDGTGFHQIDNVPKILPKQIDDNPEVKAAKDEHARIWAAEAERNSKPIQNPYPNAQPGAYAGFGAGVGAGVPNPKPQGQFGGHGGYQTQQGYQQQGFGQQRPQTGFNQGQNGQGQYNQGGYQEQQGHQQQGFSQQRPQSGVNQGQSGQRQQGFGQQKSQSGYSSQNQQGFNQQRPQLGLNQGQQGQQQGFAQQHQQSGFTQRQSGQGQQNQDGYQEQQRHQQQGFDHQRPQSVFNQGHTGQGQLDFGQQKSQYQPQVPQGQNFGANQNNQGQNYGGHQGQPSQQEQLYHGFGSQQPGFNQPRPSVPQNQLKPAFGNQPGQQQSTFNQPKQGHDFTGQQSQNQNQFAKNPHQYDGEDDGTYKSDDSEGRWKDDTNDEPTGPPKGFFYNVDYPVGIIVSKQGGALQAGSLEDTYKQNKANFAQQLQGGAAVHGSGAYPSYQVHS